MMNIDDMAKILYMDWFLSLLVAYFVLGTAYLVFKYLTPNLYKARVVQIYGVITIVLLLLFYFVIPVNSRVQADFVKNVYDFKKNNHAEMFVLKNELTKCKGYLNSYQYFKLKKAYYKDVENTSEKNGFIRGGSLIDPYVEYDTKKICDMEL
ncbi:hypothetical protein [Acinetobacter baumannii]|uniref:hypothetical protein n=1 Tax=Acinetobacter baumannii TaxID=470 RepID=UPI002341C94E|nr:hypothetical protein [Acinetobacter baumannii]MDC4147482.1 hypothetical protein [Acinetobacter baumannii]